MTKIIGLILLGTAAGEYIKHRPPVNEDSFATLAIAAGMGVASQTVTISSWLSWVMAGIELLTLGLCIVQMHDYRADKMNELRHRQCRRMKEELER